MERLPNKDALQLLERMRGKMLMLYPPIDIASDEMMQEQRTLGTYAIGYSLREQYWDLWNDWEELGGACRTGKTCGGREPGNESLQAGYNNFNSLSGLLLLV